MSETMQEQEITAGTRVRVLRVPGLERLQGNEATVTHYNGVTSSIVGGTRRLYVHIDGEAGDVTRYATSWQVLPESQQAVTSPPERPSNDALGNPVQDNHSRLVQTVVRNLSLSDEERASFENAVLGTADEAVPVTTVRMMLAVAAAVESRLQSQLESTQASARRYREDFNTVGAALLEEAENRGWCSDYEAFVERVQGSLSALELPERTSEYTVRWTETYTVTVSRSQTVEARSAEDAVEAVDTEGEATADDLISAIRYDGSYEYDDNADDYEAEVE